MSLSVKQFIMSLIYKRNNNGPSTDPCGTPNNTCSMADFSPSTSVRAKVALAILGHKMAILATFLRYDLQTYFAQHLD